MPLFSAEPIKHHHSQINTSTQTAADIKHLSALIPRLWFPLPLVSITSPAACFRRPWMRLIQCSCSVTQQTRQIHIICSNHSASCLRFGSILPEGLIQPRSAGPPTPGSSWRICALIAAARLTSGFGAGCARCVVRLERLDSLHAGTTTGLMKRHKEWMVWILESAQLAPFIARLIGLTRFCSWIASWGFYIITMRQIRH